MIEPSIPQIEDRDGGSLGAAVAALWELTILLRTECPWDREQTAGTIVPHTLEEAWEVTDAVNAAELSLSRGEQLTLEHLEEELGDLLFQVCFLAMWCQEQNKAFNLESVTLSIFSKLIRRHPHVFKQNEEQTPYLSTPNGRVDTAKDVLDNWNRIKVDQEKRALFSELPSSMPSLACAAKIQDRAASTGFEYENISMALRDLEDEVRELREAIEHADGTQEGFSGERIKAELGDVLFAAVNVGRFANANPEIAVRESAKVFQARVEGAISIAQQEGIDFSTLDLKTQEQFYQRAKKGLS